MRLWPKVSLVKISRNASHDWSLCGGIFRSIGPSRASTIIAAKDDPRDQASSRPMAYWNSWFPSPLWCTATVTNGLLPMGSRGSNVAGLKPHAPSMASWWSVLPILWCVDWSTRDARHSHPWRSRAAWVTGSRLPTMRLQCRRAVALTSAASQR